MAERVRELGLHKIYPNLRSVFQVEGLESLCSSIRTQGQNEPIKIWFDGERFRIADGERRWRACKRLGLSRIKVLILD